MERFKVTFKKEGLYKNSISTLLVIVLLSTGCMATFQVQVDKSVIYANVGQNKEFVYTIGESDGKRLPDEIKVKVQYPLKQSPTKSSYGSMYFIYPKTNKISRQGKTILKRYNGRVSCEYKDNVVKLKLNNIQDGDFDWNYQVKVVNSSDPFTEVLKDIKLVKAVRPQIANASFFPKQTIVKGTNDEFICRANIGVPTPSVKWMKMNKTLHHGTKKVTLKIVNAQPQHVDVYQCIAENVGGKDKKSMALIVAYIEYGSAKKISYKRTRVEKGGIIVAECNIDGYPSPTYKWKNPDQKVIRTFKELRIGNVNTSEYGNYTCEGENAAGTLQYTLKVEVLGLPIIVATPFFPRQSIVRGNNVEFVCRASGNATIKWVRKDQTTTGQHLFIRNPKLEDSGKYTCFAENKAGIVKKTMELTVSYIEFEGKRNNEPLYITEGEHIVILCKVTGHPLPTYKWINSNGEVVSLNQKLLVVNISKSMEKYRCEANNNAGYLFYNMDVKKAIPTTKATTTKMVTTTKATSKRTTIAKSQPTNKAVKPSKITKVSKSTEKFVGVPKSKLITTEESMVDKKEVIPSDENSTNSAMLSTVNVLPYIFISSVNIIYSLFYC